MRRQQFKVVRLESADGQGTGGSCFCEPSTEYAQQPRDTRHDSLGVELHAGAEVCARFRRFPGENVRRTNADTRMRILDHRSALCRRGELPRTRGILSRLEQRRRCQALSKLVARLPPPPRCDRERRELPAEHGGLLPEPCGAHAGGRDAGGDVHAPGRRGVGGPHSHFVGGGPAGDVRVVHRHADGQRAESRELRAGHRAPGAAEADGRTHRLPR